MRISPASYRSIINFEDTDEWTVDDDVRTDGGTTVGFFDISHPQPWDNSQRLYTMTEPIITRQLVCQFSPAAGFYTLNGESVLQFPPHQEKERICACFEEIREQNPGQRILIVLDNFSSHTTYQFLNHPAQRARG